MKRGIVWISAVIYMALGIVAITLLVSAGVPLITKLRDRNTYLQTKDIMHQIDQAITDVVSEGPGSQRVLDSLTIRKGKFYIKKSQSNTLLWTMETTAVLQEPNSHLQEGNLNLTFTPDPLIIDEYDIDLLLDYTDSELLLSFQGNLAGKSQPLDGSFGLSFRHNGIKDGKVILDVTLI